MMMALGSSPSRAHAVHLSLPYSSLFSSTSHLCNLILFGIPFCYFLYLTSKLFCLLLKSALLLLESPDKYVILQNVSGCLLQGPVSQKLFMQHNALSTYYVLSSHSRSCRHNEQISKIFASWTYIMIGRRGQTFNNISKIYVKWW